MTDREYKIAFRGSSGMEEKPMNSTTEKKAKFEALWYIKNKVAKEDVSIRLYEFGRVIHEWHWHNDQFVTYS